MPASALELHALASFNVSPSCKLQNLRALVPPCAAQPFSTRQRDPRRHATRSMAGETKAGGNKWQMELIRRTCRTKREGHVPSCFVWLGLEARSPNTMSRLPLHACVCVSVCVCVCVCVCMCVCVPPKATEASDIQTQSRRIHVNHVFKTCPCLE